MENQGINVDRLRIGAVSYLNTKPLVYKLDVFAPRAQVIFDVPSRLADGLAAEEFDVALIPCIEFFNDPTYVIVSDACIGCRGPVLSVKLLSRVPISKIRSLALDEGSRTSVALVRILLDQRFGVRPELIPLPMGASAAETETDAVLLIGDRAIHPPKHVFVEEWDLGDEWCRWAELPFVFAMWVARSGETAAAVEPALRQARDAGVERLTEIAALEAKQVGLSEEACVSYLRDHLHFFLGEKERQGMNLYYRHAAHLGLVPEDRELRFSDCTTS